MTADGGGAAASPWVRSERLGSPSLVVHGGAGSFARPPTRRRVQLELDGMTAALAAGWQVLAGGGTSADAVVEAVAVMEADGTFNAGRGGVPTTEGAVETDASVMDGSTRRAAGLCAMTWPDHPVRAAAALAAAGDSVLLAGAGADRFASDAGIGARDPASLTRGGEAPLADLGTVGAVAVDARGHLAAATSTGGRPGQRPGRVGDTPVVGAGTWALDGGVAVSATGAGEAFVMAGFAHRVQWGVEAGKGVADATVAALAEVEAWGGQGGAIVLDPSGLAVVVCDSPAMAYGWRAGDAEVVEVRGAGAGTDGETL